MFKFASLIAVVFAALASAQESHPIHFQNNCGRGTPMLLVNGQVLSSGQDITIEGPLISAISYLQIGSCGLNGEGCTLVETTLKNPTSPGAGSATDISLISPHSFSVTSGFGYFNGCNGAGLDCTGPNCPGAFTNPTNGDIVSCEVNNVGLAITFCD